MIFRHLLNMRSHPTWVRGLKPGTQGRPRRAFVAPYVGAWIETLLVPILLRLVLSHPTWVRGLKHPYNVANDHHYTSHPTWVRGLKLKYSQQARA